jgi:hypothetical protein
LLIAKFPSTIITHFKYTVDKLKKSKSSGLVNVFSFLFGAAVGTLVVLLLLPLSLAMDDGKFDHGGGGGGVGGLVAAAAAAAAVAAMDDDWRQKRPATRASTVA